jgi:hypothetical protein
MAWGETDYGLGQTISQVPGALLASDLNISKTFPAVEYTGTEANNRYYEGREVSGDYYFVQNANWNGTAWVPSNLTLPARGWRLLTTGEWQKIGKAAGVTPITTWDVLDSFDASGNLNLTLGATARIGTTDAFDLILKRGGTDILTIGSGGIFFSLDNTYDFGSPSLRVRNIWSSGTVQVGSYLGVGVSPNANQNVFVVASSAATLGAIIRGFASQTADLLDIQNNTGANIFQFTSLAAMVNGIQFNPSITAGGVGITAIGADVNIPLTIGTKGTGVLYVLNNGGGANGNLIQIPAVSGVSAAWFQINSSLTGNPSTISIQAIGTDANINLNLISKGTGVVLVNGVAAAAAPTITIKKGTGLGNYTTTSLTYVRVDSTNLAYTVTVPVGQKIMIWASFVHNPSAASTNMNVALADGTADNTGILVENQFQSSGGFFPGSLSWVLIGDGASHTFNLQFKTTGSTNNILNSSATTIPVMTFWLGVAN